jgi:hypothetical protein
MEVYLAGTPVSNPIEEIKIQKFFKIGHKLHSYYHIPLFEKKWWEMNTQNKVELFLDSGAFSAWSQGKNIDIQEYIYFIKENKSVINVYSNLDVIGNAQATWNNQMIMEKSGLVPIPCFHYGEDEVWLKRILSKKYEYIALGGMVPISTKDLIYWLDYLFTKYLTDSKGIPNIKIHGFGLTSLTLMLRYPWYSVDSTSWVVTGRMGSIYIPKFRNGKWIYDENSWKVAVSNRSPSNKEAGQHIETMKAAEKAIFINYITSKGYKLGKSEFKKVEQTYQLQENEKWAEKKPMDKTTKRELEIIIEEGICNKYQLRDEMNIIYFLDLEKALPEWPWSFKKKEILNGFFQ